MASLLNKVKSVLFKEPPIKNGLLNLEKNLTATASKFLNSEGKWRTVQFKVDADWSNVRLDRLLTKKFDISASLTQKLIRTHKVWIERDAKKVSVTSSLRMETGDSVNLSEIFLPERRESPGPLSQAQEAHLKEWTLFENDSLLVLNKPSGISVHDGPGVKVSIDSLLQQRSPEHRLVHRLDRGTSGVLLVGKTRSSTESLQNLFKNTSSGSGIIEKAVKKTYLALVAGTPKDRKGQIKSTIYKAKRAIGPGSSLEAQMTTELTKRADLLDEGQVAITDYRMISAHMTKINGVRVKLSLMEFIPQTGRTHQIRAHAAEQLGCPIVGDNRYGLTTIYNLSQIPGIGHGLHLHCKSIELPDGNKYEAPLSKHFIRTMNKFPIRIKPPRPGYKK